MLTLNGVQVFLQDFGTILCVHLVGTSKELVEERYFSFWNHHTTGGELEWQNDTRSPYHAFFWVYSSTRMDAEQKVKMGLIRAAHFEMMPPTAHHPTKGRDIWPEACKTGLMRFGQIERVTWLNLRTEVDFGSGYAMGDAVAAEKSTGNFDDDVLGNAVSQGKGTLDMIKAKHTDNEPELTAEEEESVGADV